MNRPGVPQVPDDSGEQRKMEATGCEVICGAPTSQLVSWYFEPSQPQRITSGLKTNFKLSPIYYTYMSSNHKLSKNYKTSPDTTLHKPNKTHTNIKLIFCEELVSSVLPLLKKKKLSHLRLGHTGILDHSAHLSIPDF